MVTNMTLIDVKGERDINVSKATVGKLIRIRGDYRVSVVTIAKIYFLCL